MYPGTPDAPSASNNHVTIDYDPDDPNLTDPDPDGIFGGLSDSLSEWNVVDLLNGSTMGIYGGVGFSMSGAAAATHNTVIIRGGEVFNGTYGGMVQSSESATVTYNTVIVNGGKVGNMIVGGMVHQGESITAKYNSVIINGGETSIVAGAYTVSSNGSATATHNSVIISGGTVDFVYGAMVGSGGSSTIATHNSVTLSGGTVGGVMGAYASGAQSNTASDNSVIISNGEVDNNSGGGDVSGGSAQGNGTGTTATAERNTVIISGGQVGGNVYGGNSENSFVIDPNAKEEDLEWNEGTAIAENNTIVISGLPTTIAKDLWGGYAHNSVSDQRAFAGNTLKLKTTQLSVGGLYNFQYLNFTLPGSIATDAETDAEKTLLTVGAEGVFYDTYGSGGETTLDIRTPGDFFLGGRGESEEMNDQYTLVHTLDSTQALDDIATYSLYDASFRESGTTPRTLTLGVDEDPGTTQDVDGRVRGTFTISLDGEGKKLMLDVADYDAPNTDLTWTGIKDARWTDYSTNLGTNPDKSPANWEGIHPIDGGATKALRYLDGDVVLFNDSAQGFTVDVDPDGVFPESVRFENTQDYLLIGGPITGTGSLEKTKTGTVTLTGDHSYSGGTTVADGMLQIGDGGTTGSITGDVTLSNGDATLSFNRSNVLTYDGKISGSGSLTQAGTDMLILTGVNDYEGMTTVQRGSLALLGSGKISSQLTFRAGTMFIDNDAASTTLTRLDVYGGATAATYSGKLVVSDPVSAQLNFFLPQDIVSGATLLAVDNAATITNSAIGLYVSGGNLTKLNPNEKIKLIDTDDAMTMDSVPATPVSGFMLSLEEGDLLARRCRDEEECGELASAPLDPGNGSGSNSSNDKSAKSLSEGKLAGTALLNQGVDLFLSQGLSAALAPENARAGLHVFATFGGGHLRHRTGSHIDVEGFTFITGVTATRAVPAGDFTLGAFFERGEGHYRSRTDFTRGHGEVDASGVGLFAHLKSHETERGHAYAETVVRAGRVGFDFKSGDPADAYESRTGYGSASFGLGYIVRLDESSALNLYGRYLHGHQGADTVTLGAGDSVKLEAIVSRRARLGARWRRDLTSGGRIYFGVAQEHEYDGKAKANTSGDRLTTPELEGNTTLLEAGFTLTPTTESPWTLDFNLQSHTGRRKGTMWGFEVNYQF